MANFSGRETMNCVTRFTRDYITNDEETLLNTFLPPVPSIKIQPLAESSEKMSACCSFKTVSHLGVIHIIGPIASGHKTLSAIFY